MIPDVYKRQPQGGSQEDRNLPVYMQLLASPVDPPGKKGTCHSHGKGIGAQGGDPAMGQQKSLEEKDDKSQDNYRKRTKQDGPQAGAGHVGTASGQGRDLQRRDHEDESSGHGQKGDPTAVLS